MLTRRHDDGPPSRARRVGTGAGVWRGRGVLDCLGCSLRLFACHVEKNRYRCFVEVWNTKVYTSRYYVGTSIYCVIHSYITRDIRVYVQMEMIECSSIVLVRSLSLVFRTTMRRNLLVYFISFCFSLVVICFLVLLFCLVRCISGGERHLLVYFISFFFT